jgi:hypothetical protein
MMFIYKLSCTKIEEIGGVILLREFNDLQDMKEFAQYISDELMEKNRNNLALEVGEFSYNSFTTSSEYLGEFRIILKKVLSKVDIILNKETIENISKAIKEIDRAFDVY